MAEGPLPATIGPYRVLSELGRGMMGVVYKAEDTRSDRAVALKVIRMTFAISEEQRLSFERRFVEEAQIVARLDDPGIVAVHEIGRDALLDAPFIAFEYLEGRTLAALLADGPLPWKEALRLVAQVAHALHHAHQRGIVHRDIKPANIMVLPSGEAKIMDFGLAKREAGAELTSTGQFLGTPLYMSPEQALGRNADARTDIFSLGCVAYTTLTGRRAFEAESIPQVMNKVTYQHPPRPSQVSPSVPPEVDYLLARSMAKSPDDRHPTARTFAEDVEDVLNRRAPRHRAGWSPSGAGESTLVARRDAVAPPEDIAIDLEPADVDDVPRRRGHAGPVAVLGLSMLALGAVLYSSAFWKEHLIGGSDLPPATLALPDSTPVSPPAPASPPPAATPEAPPPSEAQDSAAPLPTDAAASVGSAAIPVTPPSAAETPTNVPAATPVLTAESSVAVKPRPRPRPRAEPARLSILLEHSLKSGTLRVWLDKELVLDQRLSSRVTKDLLLFKQRSGRVQDVLQVSPGVHRLRVEVKADGEVRTREVTPTFKSGVTRRLEIKRGRGKGDLTLSWS